MVGDFPTPFQFLLEMINRILVSDPVPLNNP
jgi:hypothetical protein